LKDCGQRIAIGQEVVVGSCCIPSWWPSHPSSGRRRRRFSSTLSLSLLLYVEQPLKASAGRIARYVQLLRPFWRL
jgi:hypothetical protein